MMAPPRALKDKTSGASASVPEDVPPATCPGWFQKALDLLHDDHTKIREEIKAKAEEAKDYCDGEISRVMVRVEDLEKQVNPRDDISLFLVIQNLDVPIDCHDPKLSEEVENIFKEIGVAHLVKIEESFRMGRSANPRYIPITKVRLHSKEQVQIVLKAASRLRGSQRYARVFLRESTPKYARDMEANFRFLAKMFPEDLFFKNGRLLTQAQFQAASAANQARAAGPRLGLQQRHVDRAHLGSRQSQDVRLDNPEVRVEQTDNK